MTQQQWINVSVAVIFLVVFGFERWWARKQPEGPTWRDYLLTAGGMAGQVMAGRVHGVLFGILLLWAFPAQANLLKEAPFWPAFLLLWASEEFCFYWVHRLAHEKPWLWKLHRTHHSAKQLGMLVTFRYNVFWPILQPQGWFATLAIFLGLTHVYVPFLTMTFIIGVLTHIQWRWDLPLLNSRMLRPVMWVVERVITLPDTHHAHHGLGRRSRIKHNYATSLILWDVIFGTAYFPHARQERFGLGNKKLEAKEEMFWPLVRVPEKTSIDESRG